MGDRFTCLEKANGAASKRKQRKNEQDIEARALRNRFWGNLLAQCEAIYQIAREELQVGRSGLGRRALARCTTRYNTLTTYKKK